MSCFSSFLGANTPVGFFSLFDELYNPYQDRRAYLIKGGPGTGKSTLMKKVAFAAQKNGFDVERVFCSSDPGSLDGVIVPKLKFCVADATAPHVVEPTFPGASENIINTGAFWNQKTLFERANDIRSLTVENSIYHRRSAGFLAAAGSVMGDTAKLIAPLVDGEKVSSFAVRFAARETPKLKTGKAGKKMCRFISAVSPEGLVFLSSTVTALSSRIIGIDDEYGFVGSELIGRIGEFAVRNGYDVIFCLCPMKPHDYCEHIIIPQIGLSLVTLKKAHKATFVPNRVIHVSRFLNKAQFSAIKNRLGFNEKLCADLTKQSIEMLKKAKQTHDRLESIYIQAMDKTALNDYTDKLISDLFSRTLLTH